MHGTEFRTTQQTSNTNILLVRRQSGPAALSSGCKDILLKKSEGNGSTNEVVSGSCKSVTTSGEIKRNTRYENQKLVIEQTLVYNQTHIITPEFGEARLIEPPESWVDVHCNSVDCQKDKTAEEILDQSYFQEKQRYLEQEFFQEEERYLELLEASRRKQNLIDDLRRYIFQVKGSLETPPDHFGGNDTNEESIEVSIEILSLCSIIIE